MGPRVSSTGRHALVIGVTGNNGKHLIPHLRDSGFTQISGTCRDHRSASALAREGVQILELDLSKPESVKRFAKTVPVHDAMIFNAGAFNVRHPDEYRANDDGVRRTYQALSGEGKLAPIVTHVSSSMAELAEQMVSAGGDPFHGSIFGDYTLSKYLGDRYAREIFHATHGTQTGLVILRPGALMGVGDQGSEAMISALKMGVFPSFVPWQDSLTEAARYFLSWVGQENWLNAAEQPRVSLIAAEDFAREVALVTAANLDRPRSGTFTVANQNEPYIPADIVAAGKEGLGKKRIFNPWLPHQIFAVLLWLQDRLTSITGKPSASRANRWRELSLPNLNVDRRALEESFPELVGDRRRTLAEIFGEIEAAKKTSSP